MSCFLAQTLESFKDTSKTRASISHYYMLISGAFESTGWNFSKSLTACVQSPICLCSLKLIFLITMQFFWSVFNSYFYTPVKKRGGDLAKFIKSNCFLFRR